MMTIRRDWEFAETRLLGRLGDSAWLHVDLTLVPLESKLDDVCHGRCMRNRAAGTRRT